MCLLTEAICIENGNALNLDFHRRRMVRSRAELGLGGKKNFSLRDIISVPDNLCNGKVKCRIVYDSDIRTVEYSPYHLREICSLQLISDNHIDYQYKYVNRHEIDLLYRMRGNSDDILIVKNGLITDTSFTNIVFRAGEKWVTPARPLLQGTKRQFYLEQNLFYTADIRPEDLSQFDEARIINAMISLEESPAISIGNIRV